MTAAVSNDDRHLSRYKEIRDVNASVTHVKFTLGAVLFITNALAVAFLGFGTRS